MTTKIAHFTTKRTISGPGAKKGQESCANSKRSLLLENSNVQAFRIIKVEEWSRVQLQLAKRVKSKHIYFF